MQVTVAVNRKTERRCGGAVAAAIAIGYYLESGLEILTIVENETMARRRSYRAVTAIAIAYYSQSARAMMTPPRCQSQKDCASA